MESEIAATPIKQSKLLSATDWRDICLAWSSSGLSQKSYYAMQGIKYSRFVYWRMKLLSEQGKSRTQSGRKFARITVKEATPPAEPTASGVCLYFPSDHRLTFSSAPSHQSLARLLTTLGLTSC